MVTYKEKTTAAPATAAPAPPADSAGAGGDVAGGARPAAFAQPTPTPAPILPPQGTTGDKPAAPTAADAPAPPTQGQYSAKHKAEKSKALQIEFFSVSTGFALGFPAFVKSFSDTYSMEWNTDSVYGRMDPIATYKNTKRVINCSFTIPGDSRESTKLNNQKFAKLVSLMYPNYDTTDANAPAVISSSPLFKVKYTNLITNANIDNNDDPINKSGLLGYFSEFKYEPDNESNIFVDSDGNIYYQSLNCTFTLNVLHTHRVGHARGGTPFVKKYPYLSTGDDDVVNGFNILGG